MSALVVVDASTGVMSTLLCKLSKLLEDEYSRLKGVRRQIRFLRDELSSMKAVLETLADAEQLDPLKRDWRDKVRELSYDIEDCIDDFMDRIGDDHGELLTGLRGFFSKVRKLKARHEIAGEMQQLKIRAIEASERHKRYDFLEPTSRSSTSDIDPRLPALYEDVDRLVGIDGPKERVIGWFCNEKEQQEDLKVLPIVGSGGLGKTTLANQVYCQLKGQFQCTAFVSVSRHPNIQNILRQMLTQVGINGGTMDEERQLIDRIREYLKDKRYLVVVDDVWDVEAWKAIRLALFNNRCGSRIITTTRNLAIASYCSGDSSYVYQMEPLNFADSKRLFFKRAFGSDEVCYPHLEEVSKEILAKCGGLPLAIITLSSLLADKQAKDEWNMVLTAIGSVLANDPNVGNMTKILSLSYFDLPHHMRACLLYFSLFPEDYRIDKQRLISRWAAEGFIHEDQWRSAYEVGEGYFNDLINRNLIQPVDVEYGQPKACRVHDIILDFITCKAAEENFVTIFDSVEHGHASDYRVRRLCVDNRSIKNVTVSTSLILSHVRSLTVFGHCMRESLLTFRTLRVLDLGECWELENHNIANIEKLFLLKYLRLGQSRISELPRKVGELRYLETLDIRGTRIQELPTTIARLQRLAHLLVDHMIRFPEGIIGQMKSLEEVENFGVFSHEQGKSLREFSQLSKLRTLKVASGWSSETTKRSHLQVVESYLGTLLSSCNLHHLYFRDSYAAASPPAYRYPVSLELWCPPTPCILRKLHITYCYINKVPKWMSQLENLRELNLYIFSMRSEDVVILGAIPSLLFLELRTFFGTDGRILVAGFRSLKYFNLEIFCCGTLLEFEAESMRNVEHLKLELRVHKMECLNGASDFGIHHLSALTKVDIIIYGDTDGLYDLSEDIVVQCVSNRLETAMKKLPNHPTLSFFPGGLSPCLHFGKFMDSYNRRYGEPAGFF